MNSFIPEIYHLFFIDKKFQLVGLMILITLTAFAQLASIGLIMPFMGLIFNPDIIFESTQLTLVYNFVGFSETRSFTMFVGACVLSSLVIGNIFLALSLWILSRFSWNAQTKLSTLIFQRYLTKPYEIFTQINRADIQKNILFETTQVTTGVLTPTLHLISHGVTSFSIISFLFVINPKICALLSVGLISIYWISYKLVKQKLITSGNHRIRSNRDRYMSVNEAFGSFKEVKLMGLENAFLNRFSGPAKVFSKSNIQSSVASQVPRYGIEALALGLLILSLLIAIYNGFDMEEIVPVASAFGLGIFRLLPALQGIFQSISAIRFNADALHHIHSISFQPSATIPSVVAPAQSPLPFKNKISLVAACYRYPGSGTDSVSSLSFTIKKGELVAFVGSTGAGKSTVADLIMGLIRPNNGQITIDGVALDDSSLARWQKNIGYVPQEVYLTDSSIASNIAFGIPDSDIDMDAVKCAAKIAQIDDFISKELQQGYLTITGDHGVRLSGGQKQRIGIARSLYKNPEILVMDEATSGLDQRTEREVHEAILDIAKAKTVILIAHRLSTVKKCDSILFFESGRLTCQGTFEELSMNSSGFKRMLKNVP